MQPEPVPAKSDIPATTSEEGYQASAFACLPVLAAVSWYGWHRVKRGSPR
jgi:hypothetical protein